MDLNQTILYYSYKLIKQKDMIYYVHNPRTGGMYIKKSILGGHPKFQWYGKNKFQILGEKDDQHPCVLKDPIVFDKEFRNQSKTYLNDPNFLSLDSTVISVVRNPYDRYVAAFIEARKNVEKYKKYEFKDFIKEVCDKDYGPDKNIPMSFELSRKFSPYQIFNDAGYCVAQAVIRKEDLNSSLKEICDLTGIYFKPEGSSDQPPGVWGENRIKRGVSIDRDYRSFYDSESIDIVTERRYREITLFKYDFEKGMKDKEQKFFCLENINYDHEKDEVSIVKFPYDKVKIILEALGVEVPEYVLERL
jgi:hypothetical protein